MYTPKHFAMDDPAVIGAHIEAYPFAALIAQTENGPQAVHLPLLYDAEAGTLRGHIARANGFFDAGLEGASVLAIFSGPQAYVSPSWYPSKKSNPKVVPTWNYTAVHAHGTLSFHQDRDWLLHNVRALTERFEAGLSEPWSVDDAATDYIEAMTRGIIGLEISVSSLEGKAKLSQNKSAEDRTGVAEALDQAGDEALARMMKS